MAAHDSKKDPQPICVTRTEGEHSFEVCVRSSDPVAARRWAELFAATPAPTLPLPEATQDE
jgi:hypothetical protein